MSATAKPIVVAYDGSEPAQGAVRAAADLFPGQQVLVVTVWEAGLALIAPSGDLGGLGPPLAGTDFEAMSEVDDAVEGRARRVAEHGCQLARGLGLAAEAVVVPDELNVPQTLVAVAEERDARAIVLGSRGLARLRSHLLGSTSRSILHRCHRPVLVVRDEHHPAEK